MNRSGVFWSFPFTHARLWNSHYCCSAVHACVTKARRTYWDLLLSKHESVCAVSISVVPVTIYIDVEFNKCKFYTLLYYDRAKEPDVGGKSILENTQT